MKLLQLDPDSLTLSNDLGRSGSAKSFEERLRLSIEEIGLAEPLKVAKQPQGGYVVIDGAIDTEWIKANFPERYNSGPDAILDPDHIAETYWQLHRQPRSAWTFEMDLRPWQETW